MKVLFICKKRNNTYGISVGLSNSARFVAEALGKKDIRSSVISVDDANSIDREVTLFDPDVVVLEALWVTPSKMREILGINRHQRRKWTIRIHSKTPFLANEGIALGWLNGYYEVIRDFPMLSVSANNAEFVYDLGEVLDEFVDYLPNIYEPPYSFSYIAGPYSDYLDVGCFGAIRPLKNHLQQAFAAIIFSERIGKHLRFHINSSRTEQRGDEVLKNLRGLFQAQNGKHELIEHPWLAHEDFVKVAAFMDLGMQVSFSESFNIVTADMVCHKVPMVVSDDVDWMPTITQANPTDTKDILAKMEYAYRYPLVSTRKNSEALTRYNKQSTQAWTQYLRS